MAQSVTRARRFERLHRWAVFGALLIVGYAAAQVPPAYVAALQKAKYTVYSGDINSDGRVDLLLKAKPRIIVVSLAGDSLTPIPIKPTSPTFLLQSNADGTYTLVTPVTASTVNSSVWQANTHDLTFADILGNGVGTMLILPRSSGSNAFTISTSVSNGAPQLLQQLSSTTLGIDLGASGTTTEFRDANHDSRSDLVVRHGGLISIVFIADAQGHFQKAPDAMGGAYAAWKALSLALDLGDRNSALNMISMDAVPKYTTAIDNLESTITGLTQYWSDILFLNASGSYATFLLTQSVGGATRLHIVTFAQEDSRWVVDDF